MKRQKVKWRFQNILMTSAACLVLGQALAQELVVVVDADSLQPDRIVGLAGGPIVAEPVSDDALMEDMESFALSEGRESDEAVALSAKSIRVVPPAKTPLPPTIKGSLKDFKMPDEERFWQVHGVERTPAVRRAVARLREHLIGTRAEKASAFRYCEARGESVSKDPRTILTPEGISCLYYRWQIMLRERKASESAMSKAKPATAAKTKKKTASGKKQTKSATVSLSSSQELRALSGLSYQSALKQIEFKTEIAALKGASVALENPKDCSLTAARAAILRDLENFLPAANVWQMMNQLYAATSPCLSPDHEAFEVVNLRMALLHLDKSDLNRAASILEVALQGKELKEEHSALFWRGYLDSLAQPVAARSNGTSDKSRLDPVNAAKNTYWEKLVERYPLTLHSLVVDHINGIDTYERYAVRPAPQVSMYQGQDWNLENVSHLMAGVFMVTKGYPELERLARLLDESGVASPSFEVAMFRLKVFEAAQNQRAVIKVIWNALRTHGSKYLCEDLLELLYPVKYRNEIAQQAAYIDPALIFSLIRQESSFNPRATSPVGARGLMQVMPSTARRLERKKNLDLYDPTTSIRLGSKYLSLLRQKHKGDYARLIASYNAGPNNTLKWDARYNGHIPLLFADLIPFPETRHYVSGLMRHMYWYRALVSHLKEAPGAVKINWSWSLEDAVPRAEQFGVKKGEVFQVRIQELPWQNSNARFGGKAAAEK